MGEIRRILYIGLEFLVSYGKCILVGRFVSFVVIIIFVSRIFFERVFF